MRSVSTLISVTACLALAVGTWGMAHATPSHDHLHAVDPSGSPTRVLTKADVVRAQARHALPKLRGTVTAQANITISSNTVPAGRYRLIVNDSTSGHNWHLFGMGLDRKTSISGKGITKFRVKLKQGNYTVHCDRHPTTMTFTLKVT